MPGAEEWSTKNCQAVQAKTVYHGFVNVTPADVTLAADDQCGREWVKTTLPGHPRKFNFDLSQCSELVTLADDQCPGWEREVGSVAQDCLAQISSVKSNHKKRF